MILTAQGISKRFGAVEALSGAQPADSGDIQIDGAPVTIRSLLALPRLVILDEPTAALGVVRRRRCSSSSTDCASEDSA